MTEPASPDLAESAQEGAAERIMTLAGPVLSDIVAKLIDQNPEAVQDFSRLFPARDAAGAQSIADGLVQQHQQIAALMQEAGAQLGAAATDVTTLDWVTPGQQQRLGHSGHQGDWRQWLPAELDRREPSWTVLTPEKRTETLGQFIDVLSLPFEPEVTDIAENVMQPALEELYDRIPELADQLGWEPDELRKYINDLPDEFFADRIDTDVTA